LVADSQTGQVALITGAAKGLGAAFATRLATAGFEIVACDIDPSVDRLDGLTLRADVSEPDDVRRVVDAAMEAHGRIDVLINNAAIARGSQAGQDWAKGIEDYQQIMGTNVFGVFLFGRAVAPIMIEQRVGHIVNVSTDHIYPTPGVRVHGHGGMDLYNASKWALNGFTLDWATSLGPHGIRVNGLCLGATDTPMLRDFAVGVRDEVIATWMKPEQICDLFLDLHAEGPSGRSGHNLGCWVGRPLSLEDSIEVGHRRSGPR
jgi:NAD(P)-dependent dehydrogenase (short-subunit alcohol dehydrogenase family)